MSSAFYPLGMSSYNNRTPQGGFKPWKGNNPVGITSGTIRPLTNKDPGNNFPGAFGKPRPIKHARKGTTLYMPVNAQNENDYITIDRNLNREVRSSTSGALVKQMIDIPGSFNITNNVVNNPDQQGICVVADYYPNKSYLTENPQPVSTIPTFCCNPEKKARRRVLPASTNLKKNYYTTLEQYRENRCQTYEQRAFNFVSSAPALPAGINQFNPNIKPGGPLSQSNTYVANCQPNGEIAEASILSMVNVIITQMISKGIVVKPTTPITTFPQLIAFIQGLSPSQQVIASALYDSFITNPYTGMPLTGPDNLLGCKLVIYKPNNYQFAQQGGVTASTVTLKLNVTTIQKNLYNISRNNEYIYKNKAPPCNPALYNLNGDTTSCPFINKTSPIIKNGFFFKKNHQTL